MDEKQLQALANELAKNLKTPEDLSQFDRLLKKLSVEAVRIFMKGDHSITSIEIEPPRVSWRVFYL
ncbi:hypothetical protein KJE01_22685 [Escherichia marmotae]|uniref:hypothetical protein n=1 Tax=Escherichia TaxID=561 RepID=UPI0012FFD220|nr:MULTISPECIES: hypothetical protein [Escherichia]EFI5570374.1 hypothetical protein [Escherichia coli]MDQ9306166.1 hypothetical protein [Escherichia marmotae]HAW3343783.1 hypothetical protein [Escherichia coli]